MLEREKDPKVIEARQARAKSRVRIFVTQISAIFVFGGGALMILALGADWVKAEKANVIAMKEIFMTILPIATGVITYWFADRAASKVRDGEDSKNGDEENDK